jgi:hypothetical protein
MKWYSAISRKLLTASSVFLLHAAGIIQSEAQSCQGNSLESLHLELRARNVLNRFRTDPNSSDILEELRSRLTRPALGFRSGVEISAELNRRSSTSVLRKSSATDLTEQISLRNPALRAVALGDLKLELKRRDPKLAEITEENLKESLQSATANSSSVPIDEIAAEISRRNHSLRDFSATSLRAELTVRSGPLAGIDYDSVVAELKLRDPTLEVITKAALMDELSARAPKFVTFDLHTLAREAIQLYPGKKPDEVELFNALSSSRELSSCSESDLIREYLQTQTRINGPDDRQDIKSIASRLAELKLHPSLAKSPSEAMELNARLNLASGVALIVPRSHLERDSSTNRFNLKTVPYKDSKDFPLCASPPVRFLDQPAVKPPVCTGFLTASDTIVTVDHCLTHIPLQDLRVVFGYAVEDAGPTTTFEPDQVFEVLPAIVEQGTGSAKWIKLKLSRAVSSKSILGPAQPAALKVNDKIYAIGYPDGLPLKVATNSTVSLITMAEIFSNLDTFAGNSGSPVLQVDNDKVLGVLDEGSIDYYMTSAGCLVQSVCTLANCGAEIAIRFP